MPNQRIPNNTQVHTVHPEHPSTDWAPGVLRRRQWDVDGVVTRHSDSHGLCYEVRHPDGTLGWYEARELRVLGQTTDLSELDKLNSGVKKGELFILAGDHKERRPQVTTIQPLSDEEAKAVRPNFYTQEAMAERAKHRSPNYASMTPEEQWGEDKRLGILDWDGKP